VQTEDGLVHIEWYERKQDDSTETPEYDEIVFPDEAVYEKVRSADFAATYQAGQGVVLACNVCNCSVVLVHC
jgi:hypothetical protein